jgi:hypothetical protein
LPWRCNLPSLRAEIVSAGHDATTILLYHHSLGGSRTKGDRIVAPGFASMRKHRRMTIPEG